MRRLADLYMQDDGLSQCEGPDEECRSKKDLRPYRFQW